MSEITLHFHAANGRTQTVQGRTGNSLMQAAVKAGIDGIAADCGGCLSCATCHVFVDPAWFDLLPAAGNDELAMLESTATPQQANSRLSCQIDLTADMDGLVVQLPATQY